MRSKSTEEFILMKISCAASLESNCSWIAFSAVLLALALLANFFSSNVALLLVGSVVAFDLFKIWWEPPATKLRRARANA